MADKRERDRRPTRLSCYDYSQNGLYFLTICTKHRQKILCDIVVGDGVLDVPEIKLTPTGKIVEKYIHSINFILNNIIYYIKNQAHKNTIFKAFFRCYTRICLDKIAKMF